MIGCIYNQMIVDLLVGLGGGLCDCYHNPGHFDCNPDFTFYLDTQFVTTA